MWPGHFLASFDVFFLESFFRTPLTKQISTFGISREHLENAGAERKREREEREEAGSLGVLTLYVAFCPPLIILSLLSYSYLVYSLDTGTNLSGAKLSLCVSNPLACEQHEDFKIIHVFPTDILVKILVRESTIL